MASRFEKWYPSGCNLLKGAAIPYLSFKKTGKTEDGNVLFLILIAVALFAALTFVVANSTRSGSGSTVDEKARLLASQILNYSVAVSTGLNRLISSGCRLEQINFEPAPFDGSNPQYVNATSPDDFSCHIFHVKGGGVPYQIPPEEAQDIPVGQAANMREYYYNLSHQVPGISTDGMGPGNADSKDFMIIMPYAKIEVCKALNRGIKREYDAPPENINTLNVVGYSGGDIAALGSADIEDADGILAGQGAACIHANNVSGVATAGAGYYFYNVIMSR